jgi:hypothetical protein
MTPGCSAATSGWTPKTRAEGCGDWAGGGTGACQGQHREKDWAAGYGSAAGAGGGPGGAGSGAPPRVLFQIVPDHKGRLRQKATAAA